MGILNVTPDSFSDAGRFFTDRAAIDRGAEMIDQGADIVDVGGESTRPGSDPVSADDELRRTIPVIEQLARHITTTPISIDTRKAEVAAVTEELQAPSLPAGMPIDRAPVDDVDG